MSTLTAIAPTVKPTITIVIKGTLYDVEPIPAGESGLAAVRLTKRSLEGETYDVVLTEDGRAECDCPSYEFTYRGTAGTCKHGSACLAKGLLVAPVAAPVARPVVAPVTPADVKRARYFGLNIPPAPVAPAAPVVKPVVKPVVAPVVAVEPVVVKPAAPVAELAPEIPATNPRDSWPAWTDADRWTTEAPSVAPIVRTTAPRAADIREMGEWLAVHWTLPVDAPVAIDEAPVPASDDESACSIPARPARSVPTPDDEAYHSGFTLQLEDGISAAAPSEWPMMRRAAFRMGQADGLIERHRREDEDRDYEAWLDERAAERMAEAFGEPGDDWHDSERIEAVGCLAARLA